jgi:hypothetical protein
MSSNGTRPELPALTAINGETSLSEPLGQEAHLGLFELIRPPVVHRVVVGGDRSGPAERAIGVEELDGQHAVQAGRLEHGGKYILHDELRREFRELRVGGTELQQGHRVDRFRFAAKDRVAHRAA